MRRPLVHLALPLALGAAGCGLFSETPLQKAVKAHDAAAVERLLAAGARAGASFAEAASARELAFSQADPGNAQALEVLRLFLAANPRAVRVGASAPPAPALVNASFSNHCTRGPCGRTSAIEIVVRIRNLEAVKLMLASGLDLRSQGVTDAVVYALAETNDEAAKLLVSAGADPNAVASGGNRYGKVTALEAARRRGNAAMAAWLESRGAR
jgi:ankyrin repeat protein